MSKNGVGDTGVETSGWEQQAGYGGGIEEATRQSNDAVKAVQEKIIAALQSRVSLEVRLALDQELHDALTKRDDVAETRRFLVEKERRHGQVVGGVLSCFTFLCRWGETHTPQRLPALIQKWSDYNEVHGVTGVLYSMSGWFAAFLEGEVSAVDKLSKFIQQDPSFNRQWRIIDYNKNVRPAIRVFPDDSLRVVRIDEPQAIHQRNPESTILHSMQHFMSLSAFRPTWNSAVSLTPLVSSSDEARAVFNAASFPVAVRVLLTVSPLSVTWADSLSMHVVSMVLEKVTKISKQVLERSTPGFEGCVVGPHQETLLCCARVTDWLDVSRRAMLLFEELRRCAIIEEHYCPVLSAHVDVKMGLIMNGLCTVVGPALRFSRNLSILARQEHFGVLLSHHVADRAERAELVSAGSFLIEKEPVETFVPIQMESFRWTSVLDTRRRKKSFSDLCVVKKDTAEVEVRVKEESTIPGGKKVGRASKWVAEELESRNRQNINDKPVKGLLTQDELRRQFDAMMPSANGTIGREQFDALYHTMDHKGITIKAVDFDNVLERFTVAFNKSEDGEADNDYRMNFEQFSMMMYKISNW